jgi:hypothetical protein
LTIHPTYPEDAGVYTCVLNNSVGEAQSSANLTTVTGDSLLLDPMHEQALSQINYIEGQEVGYYRYYSWHRAIIVGHDFT